MREQGLQADWIEVDRTEQLYSYLHQGKGDLILRAGASFYQDKQKQVQLTLQLLLIKEYLKQVEDIKSGLKAVTVHKAILYMQHQLMVFPGQNSQNVLD